MLIVDDSADMRRCIREFLPDSDEKRECSDGNEAVRVFIEYQPDWVLMDIEMKPLDGLSAARQIRALNPQAHIIFVTSHSLPRYREIAAELQADGFVSKDNLGLINQIISQNTSL